MDFQEFVIIPGSIANEVLKLNFIRTLRYLDLCPPYSIAHYRDNPVRYVLTWNPGCFQ